MACLKGVGADEATATSLRSLRLTTFILGCIIPLEWRRNKDSADEKSALPKGFIDKWGYKV
jgi:hypothetical protein